MTVLQPASPPGKTLSHSSEAGMSTKVCEFLPLRSWTSSGWGNRGCLLKSFQLVFSGLDLCFMNELRQRWPRPQYCQCTCHWIGRGGRKERGLGSGTTVPQMHCSYQMLLHFLEMFFICSVLLELHCQCFNGSNKFHQCHWRAGLQSFSCCQAGSGSWGFFKYPKLALISAIPYSTLSFKIKIK